LKSKYNEQGQIHAHQMSLFNKNVPAERIINNTTYQYVLELISRAKSEANKNFKNAFVEDWIKKGDKYTYENKRYVDKAIDILEEEIKGKEEIAKAMGYIIKRNGKKMFVEFEKSFMKDYAHYLKE